MRIDRRNVKRVFGLFYVAVMFFIVWSIPFVIGYHHGILSGLGVAGFFIFVGLGTWATITWRN
jgi:hypothetical protein